MDWMASSYGKRYAPNTRETIRRFTLREYLPEIAWETEVWIADAPEHLIHFNGERFLGPYERGR